MAAIEKVKLYRGVYAKHPKFELATMGTVEPIGGLNTIEDHNLSETKSPYTSWIFSLGKVMRAARNIQTKAMGVVLVLEIESNNARLIESQDVDQEEEMLIIGIIKSNEIQ